MNRAPRFLAALLVVATGVARADGPPTVAFLGIAAKPADSAAAGLPDGIGLAVTFVDPSGPAHAAVRVGDVVHKLDDQLLVNAPQMVTLVRTHKPGDTVVLTVIRDGRPVTVPVKLGGRPRPKPAACPTRAGHRSGRPWARTIRCRRCRGWRPIR